MPRTTHSWSASDEVTRIDDRLATLGRGLGAMRLRVGEGLLRLEALDGVRALGFPSLEAYAREALGRSGRWGTDVRCLARRLSRLPRLRSALVDGALSSSMVELVSRVATPEDDADWVERAGSMTVRGMRQYLKAARSGGACTRGRDRLARRRHRHRGHRYSPAPGGASAGMA